MTKLSPFVDKRKYRPSHVLLMGPSGVGKTELSRCLADLTNAPFISTNATSFSQVGYVGRAVTEILDDLVDAAEAKYLEMARSSMRDDPNARKKGEGLLRSWAVAQPWFPHVQASADVAVMNAKTKKEKKQKKKLSLASLLEQKWDTSRIPLENTRRWSDLYNDTSMPVSYPMYLNGRDALMLATETVMVQHLLQEDWQQKAFQMAESSGVIFIDEIDKLAMSVGNGQHGSVSTSGVQRDLIPLLSGSEVNLQRRGVTMKTDNILFVCAGAFLVAKPEDMLPELRGRLANVVDLAPLTKDELLEILQSPHSIASQKCQLLRPEGIELTFADEALDLVADIAEEMNKTDNFGARRLSMLVEKLLTDVGVQLEQHPRAEKLSSEERQASDLSTRIRVDQEWVSEELAHELEEKNRRQQLMESLLI
ncbi:MAG: hypothetical protein MHM6MM_002162 [Cercozoa sp. M6MM]